MWKASQINLRLFGRNITLRRVSWRMFMVLLVTTMFLGLWKEIAYMSMYDEYQFQIGKYQSSGQSFKTILSGEPPVSRKEPKILLYTNFFGSMKWFKESKNVFQDTCPLGCTLTNDKSELETADAVVYHLSDIASQSNFLNGFRFPFPTHRDPNQVWVFFNIEPLTMIWGDMAAWQGMFNWTWSYTQNSDIYAPYGKYEIFNSDKVEENRNNPKLIDADYFGSKSKEGAIVMISHCTDEARRYRIIGTLEKYIPVRVLGRCGEGCPNGYLSCTALLPDYKFYLAFENSDCEDYVSEKYWRSLERGQIPIVAWKLNHDDIVIPGSYINVNDFPDLDAAGRYIQKVSNDKELYNSYFQWRFTHKISTTNGFCELCQKLKDATVPKLVYHDMNGWIMNQTCKPVTLSRFLHRTWDRFTYDGRIH